MAMTCASSPRFFSYPPETLHQSRRMRTNPAFLDLSPQQSSRLPPIFQLSNPPPGRNPFPSCFSQQNGTAGGPLGEEGKDIEGPEGTLSVIVAGASGELARTKVFPAFFALYHQDLLPQDFVVFGYAQSKLSDDEFRQIISRTLTTRVDHREICEEKMDQFLKRCYYYPGQYNSDQQFAELDIKLKEKEGGKQSNRLFYLSIPLVAHIDVVRCASLRASSTSGWTRFLVEKPFGQDSESSEKLTTSLKEYLSEDQIFRIDHYINKQLVENLLVLRFSNIVFQHLWSRTYIENVQFIISKNVGIERGGGYSSDYCIVKDVMQSHILQLLAFFAMEPPISLEGEDVRDEKVRVLSSTEPLQLEDVVLGQYKGGYNDKLIRTFAAAVLFIRNPRWDGVPFLIKVGRGLDSRRSELRVKFRDVPGKLYKRHSGSDLDKATNELVLRVEPDEAVYLKINNRVPGEQMRLDRSEHNLLPSMYSQKPNGYERLLMDALEGDGTLFIRSDELAAAWAILTPVLKKFEETKIVPELYSYGSTGPLGAYHLAAKYNALWADLHFEDP